MCWRNNKPDVDVQQCGETSQSCSDQKSDDSRRGGQDCGYNRGNRSDDVGQRRDEQRRETLRDGPDCGYNCSNHSDDVGQRRDEQRRETLGDGPDCGYNRSNRSDDVGHRRDEQRRETVRDGPDCGYNHSNRSDDVGQRKDEQRRETVRDGPDCGYNHSNRSDDVGQRRDEQRRETVRGYPDRGYANHSDGVGQQSGHDQNRSGDYRGRTDYNARNDSERQRANDQFRTSAKSEYLPHSPEYRPNISRYSGSSFSRNWPDVKRDSGYGNSRNGNRPKQNRQTFQSESQYDQRKCRFSPRAPTVKTKSYVDEEVWDLEPVCETATAAKDNSSSCGTPITVCEQKEVRTQEMVVGTDRASVTTETWEPTKTTRNDSTKGSAPQRQTELVKSEKTVRPVDQDSFRGTNDLSQTVGSTETAVAAPPAQIEDPESHLPESLTLRQKLKERGLPIRLPRSCQFSSTYEKWMAGSDYEGEVGEGAVSRKNDGASKQNRNAVDRAEEEKMIGTSGLGKGETQEVLKPKEMQKITDEQDEFGVEIVTPSESGVETVTPNESGVETVTPDDFGVETVTPDESGVETVTPDESGVETVTPDESGVEMVIQSEPGVEMVIPIESEVDTVTPNESGVETGTPDESGVKTVTPDESEVETVTPDESKVETVTPDESGVETVTPDESGVETVTQKESGLETVTPDESGVEMVTQSESGVETLTPIESGVDTVTPDESGLETVTSNESVVDTVTPYESRVETITPDESGVEMVTPDESGVEMLAPEESQVEMVTPYASGVEMVAPDLSGVDTATVVETGKDCVAEEREGLKTVEIENMVNDGCLPREEAVVGDVLGQGRKSQDGDVRAGREPKQSHEEDTKEADEDSGKEIQGITLSVGEINPVDELGEPQGEVDLYNAKDEEAEKTTASKEEENLESGNVEEGEKQVSSGKGLQTTQQADWEENKELDQEPTETGEICGMRAGGEVGNNDGGISQGKDAAVKVNDDQSNDRLAALCVENIESQMLSLTLMDVSNTDDDTQAEVNEPPVPVPPVEGIQRVYSPPEICVNDDGNVAFMMSYIESPGRFWVHLVTENSYSAIESLMHDLNQYYKTANKWMLKKFFEGDNDALHLNNICCAQFSEDNDFYRVEIVSIRYEVEERSRGVADTAAHVTESGDTCRQENQSRRLAKVKVFYIDFGNSEWLSPKRIYPLPPLFATLAPQAVCCRLVVLEPLTAKDSGAEGDGVTDSTLEVTKWSSEATQKFTELTGFDKKLFAYVTGINDGEMMR